MIEPELCAKLLALIDNIIERMLDYGAVEPGLCRSSPAPMLQSPPNSPIAAGG